MENDDIELTLDFTQAKKGTFEGLWMSKGQEIYPVLMEWEIDGHKFTMKFKRDNFKLKI